MNRTYANLYTFFYFQVMKMWRTFKKKKKHLRKIILDTTKGINLEKCIISKGNRAEI